MTKLLQMGLPCTEADESIIARPETTCNATDSESLARHPPSHEVKPATCVPLTYA